MTTSAGIDSGSTPLDRDVHSRRAPVSFNDEKLLLVNELDTVLGYADKQDIHHGAGLLHRAFSVFLFDETQRLLVHRRASAKPLWPGFWTNSCCSHPRRGENLNGAVERRVREELGVSATAQSVYSFEYRAEFQDQGTEHELCHVFLAQATPPCTLDVHEDEIAQIRWLSLEEVDELVQRGATEVTPWFALEWRALRTTYAPQLHRFLTDIDITQDVA